MLADHEPQQIITFKCSCTRIVIPSRLQQYKTEVNHSLILYWYVSSLYLICYIMYADYNVQVSQLRKVEKYRQLGHHLSHYVMLIY